MAPPRKTLKKEQIKELEILAQYLTREQIADHFGIGRSTLQNIFERQPKALEAYRRGVSRMILAVSKNLTQLALAGDRASAMFIMKCRGGWRETQAIDHTSSDGSVTAQPVQILIKAPDAITDDD